MQVPQLMYCFVAVILIGYWINRAENKWFLGAVLFWLFSMPIIDDPRYTIPIPFAGIELQSSRILFLFLLAMLFIIIIKSWIERKSLLNYSLSRFRFYELWIVIFFLVAMAITVTNINLLGARTVVVNLVKMLTFLLIYFFARECVSPEDFRLLVTAIVVFAVFSSLVGTYQFFINESFFRVGIALSAFGSYVRGNGLFFSEYDQGLFLTFTMILGLMTIQSKLGKALIVVLLSSGVFCTMHRGSWAIFMIALGIILLREFRRTYPLILAGVTVMVLLLFILVNLPVERFYSGSFLEQMINERLQADTLNVRLNLIQFAIDMIQKHPLGIGDYASSIYVTEAYRRSIDFVEGSPLVIHNGLLSTGVLFGIGGGIAFALFISTTVIHYMVRKRWSTNIGLMVVLIMVSFFLINMTQDLSFLGEPRCLFLGLLLGSAFSVNSYAENPNRVLSTQVVARGYQNQKILNPW